MRERFCNYLLILGQMPLPVEDFGHILTDLVDVVLGGNQLVVHLLNQISALVAQLGQMQQGILHQIISKICVYRIVLYSSKLYAPNRHTAPNGGFLLQLVSVCDLLQPPHTGRIWARYASESDWIRFFGFDAR